MKNLKTLLFAAISLTLPVSALHAQQGSAPPSSPAPPQPPNAPQGLPQGGPRPDGQRGGGGPVDGRKWGGVFGLLDTNHDGVIDAEEMKNAPEILKKLDRKGDGKLTPDEFPQGDGRSMRRPEGNGQPGGQAQPGQGRADGRPDQPRPDGGRRPSFDQSGPQGPGPQGPWTQQRSGRQQDPRAEWMQWMQRREQFAREMRERMAQRWAQQNRPGPQPQPGQPGGPNPGPQPGRDFGQNGPQPGPQGPGPQGPQPPRGPGGPQHGPQFADKGPQAPWDRPHHPHFDGQFGPGRGFAQNGPQQRGPQGPGPQPGQQFAQNGPQGPWGHPHHHHHHHFDGHFGPRPDWGIAQNRPPFGGPQSWGLHHHFEAGRGFAQNRPQFGPQPGMQRGPGFPCTPQGPSSMGPRPNDGMRGGQRPGGFDFRQFSHRGPGPDGREQRDGRDGFHPSPEGPRSIAPWPGPDGRRFDGNRMNRPPGPGGPQPDNRNPSGHGPGHHHFGPAFSDNWEQSEEGVAGPAGDPAPEFQPQPPAPEVQPDAAPNGVGEVNLPPAGPGDVI